MTQVRRTCLRRRDGGISAESADLVPDQWGLSVPEVGAVLKLSTHNVRTVLASAIG